MNIKSEWKAFGGKQRVVEHDSKACKVPMTFGLFTPPDVKNPPVLYYLSGLTCTWENATTKAGFQRVAADLGIAVVTPDTSPRGSEVADADDRWDLGTGAGFYVDATAAPWSDHYHMHSYVTEELPELLGELGVDTRRASITGHSMGGHGALVLGLREPERYRSISAFSPIVNPSAVQWGKDAFGAYLASEDEWAAYDATRLIESHSHPNPILIDQGGADGFLEDQLRTWVFEEACQKAGQATQITMREGYDHSYYFVASFLEDHLRFHAQHLKNT